MRKSSTLFLCIALLIVLRSVDSLAQAPEWHDELVDRMTGNWKLTGQVMGHDAHHAVQAEWVLNHQFLRIHEKTATDAPPDEHSYEATWFLGYDPVSERYILHLLDVFGARFSETLGYGTRDGNALHFVFEYPDGPFHTTFRWSPDNSWEWLMQQKNVQQKNNDGKWSDFADLHLTKASR
jgi:hypothetical protein